jgi:hypothetical protein
MKKIFLLLLLVPTAVWAQSRPIVPGDVGIQTPFSAAGNLLVAGPTTGQIQDSAARTSANVPVGLNFNYNIAFGAATQSASTSLFWANGTGLSGSVTAPSSGIISPVNIYYGTDTANPSNGLLLGLSVYHASSGAGRTGGRYAIQGLDYAVGTPTAAGPLVGVVGFQQINANQTGTAGSYTTYAGSSFGGNFKCWLQGSATFIGICNGAELNAEVDTGASTAEKHGLSIVKVSADAVRGAYDDSALNFNDQDATTATWQYGIAFGSYAHKWPFGTDSTLIGAQIRQIPSVGTDIALYGVDFSNVTFQSGGCAFKSTGFCIDPSGNANLSSAGSTSAPTLAFTNCGTNCGWYAPASNQIGLVVGGSLAVDNGITRAGWTFTGQVVGSIAFIVASNTGNFGLRGGATLLTSPATATLQLGSVDAASPVAQTLQAQNVLTGTSNTSSVNTTIIGSLSTGSGTSGDIIFKTGGTGAGATTQNSATNALIIKGATQNIQVPAVATGTPVASLCLDASNNIIKKTTAGSCI